MTSILNYLFVLNAPRAQALFWKLIPSSPSLLLHTLTIYFYSSSNVYFMKPCYLLNMLINTFYMTLRSARFSSFLFVLRFSWYYFGIHPKKIIRNFRKASNMCIFNFSFKKFCVTKELQNDWNMKLLKKFMEPGIRKILFFSWKMKIIRFFIFLTTDVERSRC